MRKKHAPIEFTGRELDVLELLAQGKTYLEISNDLFVCLGTVNVYISRIKAKTGIHKKDQLVEYAINVTGMENKTSNDKVSRLDQAKLLLKQAMSILSEISQEETECQNA